jgi:AcrR family transcriptional regulator
VLATAGVGKGQFYYYFADKDALVRAVIARQSGRILDGQRDTLEHLDSWAAIAAWFARMVQVQEQRGCVGGCPLGSLASELADQDEAARTDLVATFDRWEGYLASGLERMRAGGQLRADADPAVLAMAAMASIQGGLLLTQTRKDVRALQRALDGAFAYLGTFAVSTPHG